MTITLDQNIANSLNQGMKNGDAIELPFPVVFLWAKNGEAAYKSQGGALYFGGWACGAEDAENAAGQQGLTIPAGWQRISTANREGGEYEAYTTRYLIIAPIARRESWIGKDGRRATHYVDGGRRHTQVLAYLAEKQGEGYVPWGPVVLTAKGYQAKNIGDAFNAWDKATSQLRWKVAPGVPAWCFYMAIGTFGKDRQGVNVGKAGAQSPITPITAHIPADMDEARLEKLFVGQDAAALMSNLKDRAAEWLAAWNAPSKGEAVQEDDFLMPDDMGGLDNLEAPF